MLQLLLSLFILALTVVLIITFGFTLICAHVVIILAELAKTPLFWIVLALITLAVLTISGAIVYIYLRIKNKPN